MALPNPVRAGDVIGCHFPSASAAHPHPGLVLDVITNPAHRAALLARNGKQDIAGATCCLMLMISHSPPAKGEYAELMPQHVKTGTLLDAVRDIFVCYKHFDIVLVPGDQMVIASARGPYLGRVDPGTTKYYARQLSAVTAYANGKSYAPPEGVFRF